MERKNQDASIRYCQETHFQEKQTNDSGTIQSFKRSQSLVLRSSPHRGGVCLSHAQVGSLRAGGDGQVLLRGAPQRCAWAAGPQRLFRPPCVWRPLVVIPSKRSPFLMAGRAAAAVAGWLPACQLVGLGSSLWLVTGLREQQLLDIWLDVPFWAELGAEGPQNKARVTPTLAEF